MAKEMFSSRIDADVRDALASEARSERRSVGNMLEWILRERYSRALTERGEGGVVAENLSAGGRAQKPAESHSRTPAEWSPRSVSADVAATIPGVKIASTLCGVSPPGRNRPTCSLAGKHDGKHSWEA